MTRKGNLIGKQLAKLRTQRDLSQAEFAARCQRLGWDVSRDVLARIEIEIRGITDRELVVLCAALEVPIQELLTSQTSRGYLKNLRE